MLVRDVNISFSSLMSLSTKSISCFYCIYFLHITVANRSKKNWKHKESFLFIFLLVKVVSVLLLKYLVYMLTWGSSSVKLQGGIHMSVSCHLLSCCNWQAAICQLAPLLCGFFFIVLGARVMRPSGLSVCQWLVAQDASSALILNASIYILMLT